MEVGGVYGGEGVGDLAVHSGVWSLGPEGRGMIGLTSWALEVPGSLALRAGALDLGKVSQHKKIKYIKKN